MMNCYQRCLLISLTALALTSCSGKTKPADPPPYLTQVQALEVQAARAYQLGNYQQALRLYDRAYAAYSAIDEQAEMAQQSVHRAQVALLLKDLPGTTQALEDLQRLLQSDDITSELRDRYSLLKANLSMQQEAWQVAEEWLSKIDPGNEAVKSVVAVNRAILTYAQARQIEAAKALLSDDLPPLSRARVERLLAVSAIDSNDLNLATSHLQAAKSIYRDNNFAPGIAECLWLEGDVYEAKGLTKEAEHTRARAMRIYRRLGIPLPARDAASEIRRAG